MKKLKSTHYDIGIPRAQVIIFVTTKKTLLKLDLIIYCCRNERTQGIQFYNRRQLYWFQYDAGVRYSKEKER